MHYEIEQDGQGRLLKLQGRCTIEQANDLREVLLSKIVENGHVSVNLEQVSEIDLTFLQLLCSAHGTSLKLSKRFALNGPLPEVFIGAVREAGYCRVIGCSRDTNGSCLWKGEWDQWARQS
ncbi:MAG: STAS domain-containing protein [Syntrophobacteraceae bacterium]|jgi:anti-anti-sigma regulatory factor